MTRVTSEERLRDVNERLGRVFIANRTLSIFSGVHTVRLTLRALPGLKDPVV